MAMSPRLLAMFGFAAAGLLFGLIGFVIDGFISFRIERHHASVVRRFDASPVQTSRQLWRFIWSKEHRALGDARLSKMVRVTRVANVASIFCMTAVVVTIWSAH